MSLLDVIRGAVKIADEVTKPLQGSVSFERFTSADAYGEALYASAVSLRAIVEWKQQKVRTQEGILIASRCNVLFLDIAATVSATGGLGISTKDRITLPNGETNPIASLDGFMDAGTGRPVATQVYFE